MSLHDKLKEAAYARDNKKNGKDWRRGVGWALAEIAEGIKEHRKELQSKLDICEDSIDGEKYDEAKHEDGWNFGAHATCASTLKDLPTNEQLDELLKESTDA